MSRLSWHARTVAVLALLLTSGCQDAGGEQHPLDATAPASAPASGDQQTPGGQEVGARTVLTIDDPRITESSGLARSRRHPGVLYTHNDTGAAAEIFAVDASGTRAVLDLGLNADDWEDVATTPDGRLWVADIGDNDGVRSTVSVSVLEEPGVLASASLPATTYEFRYPDGPHDAEALLVHPRTGRIYIATKEVDSGTVYAAPQEPSAERVNDLEAVADAPGNVTGGDFHDDGSLLVLRNQGRAFFYTGFGARPTEVPLPDLPQGESIVFDEGGRHVLVGSEGVGSSVVRVPVPGALVG